MQRLKLTQITRDHHLSPREGTSAEVAEDYAACFDRLPPVTVFKVPDAAGYLLADGWHRCRAAEILKLDEVEADVRYGSRDDALEYALVANAHHGRPLTRKEKYAAVDRMLTLRPERANAWIAGDLSVSDHTVTTAREKLEASLAIATLTELVGRDGKKYPRSIEQPKRNAEEVPAKDEVPEDTLEAEEAPEGEAPEPEPEPDPEPEPEPTPAPPILGAYLLREVHNVDAILGLSGLPEASVDLVFADPPYNLGKKYGETSHDKMPAEDYFAWCMQWFVGCYRALKPGGSLYVMHYPEVCARWKSQLDGLLSFSRWITWVYPSHVGHSPENWTRAQRTILFYTKGGKPAFFAGEADPQPFRNPDDARVAHSGKRGVTPYDWWEYDLVKNVSQDKEAEWPNQLPLDMLRRIVLTSCPEDGITVDPFSGTGTTALACAVTGRPWVAFDIQAEACKITRRRVRDALDTVALVADLVG